MIQNNIIFYIINVLAIALPVAILEIIIEKDKGWGAGHPKDKWYGKIIGENSPIMKTLSKILGVPYFFGYGIAMYFVTIPVILILEYFFLFKNLSFLIAIFIAVTALEDFLWFVLNWHFDSLTQLLKGPNGNIWWHKQWIKIARDKYLPRSYLIALLLAIFFLVLA